ncbi:LOB domain-containing protein 36 [Linum grandiflorum]
MSQNSPCAACKFLRRKCTQECVFAPYFPPDQPTKFASVHRLFGASNVAKLLNEIPAGQREDAVNSLAYEADARLRDPVYGCVGLISILQHKLKQLHIDLDTAKHELSKYIGPQAMLPNIGSASPYIAGGMMMPPPPQLHQNMMIRIPTVGPMMVPDNNNNNNYSNERQLQQIQRQLQQQQQQRQQQDGEEEVIRIMDGGGDQVGSGNGLNQISSASLAVGLGTSDRAYQVEVKPVVQGRSIER